MAWLELWHELRYALLGLIFVAWAASWSIRNRETRLPASSQSSTRPQEKLQQKIPLTTSSPQSDIRKDELSTPKSATTSDPAVRLRQGPKRIQGSRKTNAKESSNAPVAAGQREGQGEGVILQPLVFFSSLTGTTEAYAKQVSKDLSAASLAPAQGLVLAPELHDLSYIDYDDYFVSAPKAPSASPCTRYFYLLLIPTYNIDTVLNNFLDHLKETHHDFRVDTGALSGLLGYSVFGFGDKEGWPTEAEGYCSQAKEVDKWMAKLTDRRRAYPLGTGNVKGSVKQDLKDWQDGVCEVLVSLAEGGGLGEGVTGSGDAVESGDEEEAPEEAEKVSKRKSGKMVRKVKLTTTMADLEDLGIRGVTEEDNEEDDFTNGAPVAIDFTTTTNGKAKAKRPITIKPMVPVSSPTYSALTKQGYSIIGSHSGVKICRWTKSALRGRGSCYKRSFYGIASHLCMEATPSLSCSNKCVFCWRHGTNPVGTTWRWEVDPPEMILEGALEAHVKKIKVMRGVPGIRADRFAEAMRVRHCALSLVGEPIFYPRINEFLRLLHAKRISSFLVCNAQHPQQLEQLDRVTQLYVSIDASNKESLRKVDRPLHRDFWERFQQCLDILRTKRFQQRTVFRLTLVKGFNLEDEVEGYADLVERGLPCFVEIKGVTYCGTSSSAAAGLTMQNVPFWTEVQEFVVALNDALQRRGLDYGMAAEHAHSCCALLASTRFRRRDRTTGEEKWHTLIDYAKFFELLESGRDNHDFRPEDYMGEATPEWAGWGRGGFDPLDVRVDRKGRPIAQDTTPSVASPVA